MLIGRILLAALGAFYLLYAVKPRLPVIRSLPYLWRGNLPPAPDWRAGALMLGVGLIVGAALIGPPFLR